MRKGIFYGYMLIVLAFAFGTIAMSSCQKDDDNSVEKPKDDDKPVIPPTPDNPPTPEPDPQWVLTGDKGKYEYTMTAVVTLPQSMVAQETATDRLSVFAGDECRGVAERVKVDDGYQWMVMIYGNTNESNSMKFVFKYWSAATQFIHQSGEYVFNVDAKIGSVDAPEVLNFSK